MRVREKEIIIIMIIIGSRQRAETTLTRSGQPAWAGILGERRSRDRQTDRDGQRLRETKRERRNGRERKRETEREGGGSE